MIRARRGSACLARSLRALEVTFGLLDLEGRPKAANKAYARG